MNVIQCRVLAQWLGAVRAAVTPLQKDSFTETQLGLLPWDEFDLVDLMVHYHLVPCNIKRLDLRLFIW